jgi:hypothetical protein
MVWKTMDAFQSFSRSEKEALGVVTGNETEFLATHDAWRGYPRIHICQERLMGIPISVIQGGIHHEISHALNHGTLEFYTFTFSKGLQDAARSRGMDMSLLQQCVYFLSIVIKDPRKWFSGWPKLASVPARWPSFGTSSQRQKRNARPGK